MKDPVCGMTVDPAHAAGNHQHAGRTYYFCSTHCLKRFAADPTRFLSPPAEPAQMPSLVSLGRPRSSPAAVAPAPTRPSATAPAAAGTWTCPMHPQIVRDGPGACPICGMALEPRVASADETANPELVDMTRRFWVSVVTTVPLVVLAMGSMIPALRHVVPGGIRAWIELALAS